MASNSIRVGICALGSREERTIQSILSHSLSARFRYTSTVIADPAEPCDVALVDAQRAESNMLFLRLSKAQPHVSAVFLDDSEASPGETYRVPRRSLWSKLVLTLDDVIAAALGQPTALRPVHKAAAPLPQGTAAVPVKPAPVVAPVAGALHALVVDDSLTVRSQLEATLAKVGIRASGVASADAAFALLQQRSFDLLFVDIVMPGMDGYEFCRQLRRNPATRALPVVMLTSRSSAFDRARGALAGCDLYLIKPIEIAAFYAAVNKVVMKIFKNDGIAAKSQGYRPLREAGG